MPAASDDGTSTRTLLVAGTASHVGKSVVTAGLCRHLARQGVAVAPFKAQNMSNNARAVASPSDGFGEIGVSQYVQARAAEVQATTDMNPVLLKPRGDGESQLVVQGDAVDHYESRGYYENHWEDARTAAVESYERLADDYDVLVAEGAGSVAEINLTDRDLPNREVVDFADADVLLVADIERGGVFAAIYGTLELMPEDVYENVVGVVINKFRGDRSLLEPGIEEIEERTGVPVLGVLPYDDPGLPAEDSVSLPSTQGRAVLGDDDGVADARTVTVAVPRLPRISNFTDMEPLARVPGVRVAYVPPPDDLTDADAVVLPGTKNTVDDLQALQRAGFDDALAAFDGPVVGLCGGYQMLGERITNAGVESTDDLDAVDGFGLLPVETEFSSEKTVVAVEREIDGAEHGLLADANGTVAGYEIHMGDSRPTDEDALSHPLGPDSAATDRVVGTYLHGVFENESAREAFVAAVYDHAGVERPAAAAERQSPYEAAADVVAEYVDLGALGLPVE
ncbi:cobyric acid synthase [Haloarculaceae archaeon H-GB1-1]|nr:cobyric acid synthase [Haloarculaceae archaeon H-GB1-1]